MAKNDTVSIINKTKGKLPGLPFVSIKDEILGKRYDLSIAFVGPTESRNLNKKFRNKDKPTNILSFALGKDSGELVICPSQIKKDMVNFNMNYKNFFGFLIIHGMLHLKGYDHGSIMESKEKKFSKQFNFL